MGEERDVFKGLGWDEEIVSLADPHIPFNPSPERDVNEKRATDRFCDEYVCPPFSQSTRTCLWTVEEEEGQRYTEKLGREGGVLAAREVEEAMYLTTGNRWTAKEVKRASNSVDIEEAPEVRVGSASTSRFREKMRRLSPHRPPLKERIKDWTISYVDLLEVDMERSAGAL
jgi:hypothetical protein